MSNIENVAYDNVAFIGRIQQDENDDSTTLTIPLELAKELGMENSKVSVSLLYDYEGGKHLLISKLHREIIID